MRLPAAEGGHRWTDQPLRITQVIRRDDQAFVQTEMIRLSQMTNMSTTIMHMDRSFLSAMEAVLKYAGAFELQHGVSFSEARIKNIVDDTKPSQYLAKQSCLSYPLYVKFSWLMKENSDMLTLLESLNENLVKGKELGISHLDSKLLRDSRISFVVLLIEAASLYQQPTTSMAFHASSFYLFKDQLLQSLYYISNDFSEPLKPSSL